MDFLKRNLFFIVCGLVTAGGVALGVTGMQGMPEVMKQMEAVGSLYGSLNSLQPVSKPRIESERARIKLVNEDRKEVFEKAESLYGYEPLVPGVFPAGIPVKRIEFRTRYGEAMNALMQSLDYGGSATSLDYRRWADKIENEKAALRDGTAGSGDIRRFDGPPTTPAGVLTASGVQSNAQARAEIANAQAIRCYATSFAEAKPGRPASLEFENGMVDTGTVDAPDLWTTWRAQWTYWVQKDVVEAIVAVNNEAAKAEAKRGEHAWVGNMPVKEIISIRCSEGYVTLDGDPYYGAPPTGRDPAAPPATGLTVFTQSGSTDWYEVVQYTLKLVMDPRDIPALADELSKNSFHTLLRASYETIPPNRTMRDRIYGSEPAAIVVMDFEMVMLGELFRKWMPDEVCEQYGIVCPQRNTADNEEG